MTPVVEQVAPSHETATAARPNWLSVVSHTDPRYGGLSSAVPRGALAVAQTGRFAMKLAAFCAPGEEVVPSGFDEAHLSFWPVSRGPWLRSGAVRQGFQQLVQQADGLHIHGLWEASTAAAGRASRSLGKPYILSAHGMLEPWALANKRWKKRVYAALIERRIVAEAACLHALTKAEAEQYRAFGAKGPIAVIPNAVEIPTRLSAERFLSAFPDCRDSRRVLFLGRLHPKKGLDLLVDAWATVSNAFPEAHLVLAGPDAEGTANKLRQAISAAGITNQVTFTGMLDTEMKWSALASSEGFVLPSFSEGLSMGALEALGAGVPVIVTHHCNMPEVTTYRAGWEVQANTTQLAGALEELLGRTPEENRRMGERGAHLITTRYDPRHVAEAMADLYDYVLSGIPPRNVEMHVL